MSRQSRSNNAHESTTNADPQPYKKSVGKESMLRYLGHAPVENRNGLIAAAMVTSVCPLGIDQNTDGSNQNIEIEPERQLRT